MEFDVAIIGGGPAGLSSAEILSNSGLSVCLIDKGKAPLERIESNDILFGIGGAGGLSDGKLNLTPDIGMEIENLDIGRGEASDLIDYVDSVWVRNGVEKEYYGEGDKERKQKVKEMKRKAASKGVELVYGPQKHIGSDKVPTVMDNMMRELQSRDVKFLINTEVEEIEKKESTGNFVLTTEDKEIKCKHLIAAPGRSGANWFRTQANKLGVEVTYGPIDVGVRVELPKEVYDQMTDVIYDPKFRWRSKGYDDLVRTFCTNPEGYVATEYYEDMLLVNGHAKKDSKTELTNFALLVRIHLTEPVEDTKAYGRKIAELANKIGGDQPVAQRLKDLRDWRRSDQGRIDNLPYKPTLKEFTPGDISLALPQRIVMNIIHGLETLGELVPGVNQDHTLLYCPEIKFYDSVYPTENYLETNLDKLRVAGDGAGKSRGIVGGAVSGAIAAIGVLKEEGKENYIPPELKKI
ncbi:NAD(P)/FAD-dependent oxidoreductase [Methanonatronarchaeum sp. AMET-Sl]|uniref:NAD(P)/FAD-dependent oxidoreductase n=1 Tax=Methanonatronarchaeum sp. AMET-Sl TaxID=3037654 RepID=UPI00244D99B7|nr:NAD(P)/FAD-dependent oxidoreductase [Methanonatronarchaeum sp. AMET-Sl]WGI17027.1 NAD(P)/FAD-dependent oxidoreductase [Methanonatronarchaeum sp. AMET-Sl]